MLRHENIIHPPQLHKRRKRKLLKYLFLFSFLFHGKLGGKKLVLNIKKSCCYWNHFARCFAEMRYWIVFHGIIARKLGSAQVASLSLWLSHFWDCHFDSVFEAPRRVLCVCLCFPTQKASITFVHRGFKSFFFYSLIALKLLFYFTPLFFKYLYWKSFMFCLNSSRGKKKTVVFSKL